MADFTVIGECVSRELGYDKFSFIKIYSDNLSSYSLNTTESYPIINIIINIAQEKGTDFKIPVDELYKKITTYAYENNINTKSKYSKFPQSEKGISTQIMRLKDVFRNSGYEITSKRYNSRDGKYKRNTRIFYIKFIGSNDPNDTSTSNINKISNYTPRASEPRAKTGTKSLQKWLN